MSTLPSRPSLKQLKKQAKELHSAHAAGDPQAAGRIRTHLPRLTSVSKAEIAGTKVSLQEAQHVIAREYDLKNWDVLQAVVTPDFELLEFLDDRGVQELLRDIDWWDVFNGLRGSEPKVLKRFLSNVTAGSRAQIEEEISFPREVSAEEIKAARQRIMLRLAQCEAEGKLTWPSKNQVSAGPDHRTSPEYSPRLLELAGRPLEQLSLAELVEFWIEAARQENVAGLLSFEKFCDQIASPLLREGFKLVTDATEPPLLIDLLETRIQMVLYPREHTRRMITIEAAMSIRCLDYYTIVAHKVGTFYLTGAEPEKNTDYSDTSLQDLQNRLQSTPFTDMTYEQASDLFGRMGYVARLDGLESLAPLIEVAGDPLLKRGLELMVAQHDEKEMIDILQTQSKAELEEYKRRCEMVVEGCAALREGKGPDEMREMFREYQ